MDSRFGRVSYKENKRSTSIQKQMVETRKPEPVPDLTELMNDWFFGTREVKPEVPPPTSVATGGGLDLVMAYNEVEEISPSSSPRSNSSNSKLTQEWLQQAKLMVASSPGRCDSPNRLIGSPRFAAARANDLDRRDPLSRSARRHRSVESFSGEILSKSAKHTRNRSETIQTQQFSDLSSPPSSDHKQYRRQDSSEDDKSDQTGIAKPPKPIRKSRFREVTATTQPAALQSRRTFKPCATTDNQLVLSPPKTSTETPHRRSVSSSKNFLAENQVLSPPKNYVESAHRRSISSATCSLDKVSSKPDFIERLKESSGDSARDLNVFLIEQKSKIRKISSAESTTKARIVLSGSTNSTSSMVAAICYAWLLEHRIRESGDPDAQSLGVVVPVMNIKRGRMWKHRQAAWLFHHVGIDASSLLFSDEVDLESLMIARQLSMTVVGQDVLKTNGEVGSQCTILTDNYCEDAYDMLQIPTLKKLLLAGILLDTQNLNLSTMLNINRDTEAVQLLLVGSAPTYKNTLFDQLMQDPRDGSFLEAMRYNYGKPPNDGADEDKPVPAKNSVRKSVSGSRQGTNTQNSDRRYDDNKAAAKTGPPPPASKTPTRTPEPAPRPKNKFSIAKWFGFGSK